MITIKNVVSEYAKIPQSKLPEELKSDQFQLIKDSVDLYGEGSEKLDNYINLFVSELNKIVQNEEKLPIIKSSTKVKERIKINPEKVKAKRGKKPPMPKTPKPKAKREEKQKGKPVGDFDLSIKFIRSFLMLANKVVDKKRILNLYKAIEKAAVELKIRKTDTYAGEVKFIANELKEAYNNSGQKSLKIELQVSDKKVNELKAIANSVRIMPSVRFIKMYINLLDKNTFSAAKTLQTRIINALNKGEIAKSDTHYSKIQMILTNLRKYVEQGANIYPSETDLKGLAGIAGISIPKKKA